jgi:hypothetical protein
MFFIGVKDLHGDLAGNGTKACQGGEREKACQTRFLHPTGEGIPLLHPRHRLVRPKLQSVKRFSDGVVHLVYKTPKQSQG